MATKQKPKASPPPPPTDHELDIPVVAARGEKFAPARIAETLRSTRGMITAAARKLKCSTQTIYNYMERYPALRQVAKDEFEALGDAVELTLADEALGAFDKDGKRVRDPNITATIFLAKTKYKSRGFVERSEVLNVNVDPALINKLGELAESRGISLTELINELIAELSAHSSSST